MRVEGDPQDAGISVERKGRVTEGNVRMSVGLVCIIVCDVKSVMEDLGAEICRPLSSAHCETRAA